MRPRVEWAGADAAGRKYDGADDVTDIPAFVKSRFEAGWQYLTVWVDRCEAGGIHLDPGDPTRTRRSWWAEIGVPCACHPDKQETTS